MGWPCRVVQHKNAATIIAEFTEPRETHAHISAFTLIRPINTSINVSIVFAMNSGQSK